MKAIVIISGGLDSSLAIAAIQKQKIEVIAVHFLIPFAGYNVFATENIAAKKITNQLKCEFKLKVLGQKYLDMLFNPKHGYGKNINPCIDCKILMLKEAKKIMFQTKAEFIVSGEVLGQRPMSQNKKSLHIIEKESGLEGLLLRPLSAKLLPETIPQKKGWVKEKFLFNIEGRGRKRQMELAKQWGIEEYPWPGGGCLLTDPAFSNRLNSMLKYKTPSVTDIKLLKAGRHFRINSDLFFTLGRYEQENNKIINLVQEDDSIFEPQDIPGPTGVARGPLNEKSKEICCRILASYVKGETVTIKVKQANDIQEYLIPAAGMKKEREKFRI